MSTGRRNVKTIWLILAVAGVVWASPDCSWAAQNEDVVHTGVAARVNGESVAQADVQRLLANPFERRQLLRELGVEDPDGKELECGALRRLINRRLILQEAARRNLTITPQDLDKAISSLRRRFEDLQGLGVWMKEQGLDDTSLSATIRVEMLAARVRAALVEGVRVTDDQAHQYYGRHKDDLKTEEVRLQIIVVKDEATATGILAALRKGDDFGALARARSIGRRAAQGGDTGWVDADSLGPPLRDAIGAMQPRQARGPLQKGDEFLIVRLDGRRPGRARSFAEARADIERRLLPGTQQEALQAWLAEQAKTSTIEVFSEGERF
jgi:peptidyl-prolyl cis-trans isomerase SurA